MGGGVVKFLNAPLYQNNLTSFIPLSFLRRGGSLLEGAMLPQVPL
jgi:hypothetical protein